MGFLGSVLPSDGVKFTFDVDLMVDSRGKLTFAGGAGYDRHGPGQQIDQRA